MKTILAIDPSGNFNEGKGTTGWVHLREDYSVIDRGYISAEDFSSAEAYWDAVVFKIMHTSCHFVVVEGYKLYNHHGMKAETQSYSELETPQLIGIIKYECYKVEISDRLTIQYATDVKTRWSDTVLIKLGLLTKKSNRYYMGINQLPCNRHERDALRHAIHFNRYKLNNKLSGGE